MRMRGKIAFAAIALAAAFGGAWYLRSYADFPASSPVTCLDGGLTYRLGEARAAADGCNACTCGASGWSCTSFRCVGNAKAVGIVRGSLSYPSARIPSQKVCAEDGLKTVEFCTQTADGADAYALTVPEGSYYVYATGPDDKEKRAYFSEYVECGSKPECLSHSPIAVTIASGTPAMADPVDWDAAGSVDSVSITPSQYLDKTFFFMDGATFNLIGHGLSRVDVFAVPTDSEDGTPIPIGSASGTVDAKGDGSWHIPIPMTLQASDVYAVATDIEGKTIRSPGTGRARPFSTL